VEGRNEKKKWCMIEHLLVPKEGTGDLKTEQEAATSSGDDGFLFPEKKE